MRLKYQRSMMHLTYLKNNRNMCFDTKMDRVTEYLEGKGMPNADLDSLRQKIVEHNQKALRYNQGKPKWSMVHFRSLEPMVKVLMYGANKYSRDNWKKGLDRQEILDSMQRHLAALIDGVEIDEESQLPHIGHILCNCMFYSYFYGEGRAHLTGGELSSE